MSTPHVLQTTLFDAPSQADPAPSPTAERDRILADLRRKAGARFQLDAAAFVLRYLADFGETPGEQVTDACIAAGIVPPRHMDDRAFGPVFQTLARRGLTRTVAYVPRQKGHGTTGGRVWGLTELGTQTARAAREAGRDA